MMEIVFATDNKGKFNELKTFALEQNVAVKHPSEVGLQPVEVDETGNTYHENARLKVEAYIGQPAAKDHVIFADDSGIEIDALGGEPGIHSRRWLGYKMSDDEIVGYALGRLHNVPPEKRTALSRCVIACSIRGRDIEYFEGELPVTITERPIPEAPKSEGFPFRRLFIVKHEPPVPLWTFEQLSPHERPGLLSHREASLMKLIDRLRQSS